MTASLLAHAGHIAAHDGTTGFIGFALLLIGAVAASSRRRLDRPQRTVPQPEPIGGAEARQS